MLLKLSSPPRPLRTDRFTTALLWGILGLVCLFPLIVALRNNINWDEFKFLSQVYEHQSGSLSGTFQTGYVHLFGWLPYLGGSEIDQIVAGRVIYYALLLISAYLLYKLARSFFGSRPSLVVIISFFSFSSVFIHGASFRADGLLLCLYLCSLTFLLVGSRSLGRVLVAGVMFGCSVFISIKAVLLALSVIPILLLPPHNSSQNWGRGVRRLVLFGCAAVFAAGVFHVFHWASLADSRTLTGQLLAAGDKALLAGFLPRPTTLAVMLWRDATTWSVLIAGLGIILLRIVTDRNRHQSLKILCLSLPMLSVLFYRNSFTYFYLLITPSALLLIGITYDALEKALQRRHGIVLILPLLLVVDAIPMFSARSQDTLTRQREIVDAVHNIFPEPVPYIDGVSMIASYPKVGFFMSSWGLESYLARGQPIFRDLVKSRVPEFLLANASDLEIFGQVYRSEIAVGSRLLEADRRFLRGQFIHHWGPIYVPGAELELAGNESEMWETLIPGFYTVESDSPVVIDKIVYEPGSAAYVSVGKFKISSLSTTRSVVRLRWGRDLQRPTEPPPPTPIFTGL